jgi:hypothetical protein
LDRNAGTGVVVLSNSSHSPFPDRSAIGLLERLGRDGTERAGPVRLSGAGVR